MVDDGTGEGGKLEGAPVMVDGTGEGGKLPKVILSVEESCYACCEIDGMTRLFQQQQ